MNRWISIGAIAGISLALAGCVDRAAQNQSKRTQELVTNPVKDVLLQPVRVTTLTQDLAITGSITAVQDTTIGAKQNNKVVSVLVKDGDPVKAGELLAQLDPTALNDQLRQAEAQVAQAQAGVAQAESAVVQATRNAQYGPAKSTAALRSAIAQLRAAQANLRKLKAGARTEERAQAQAQLESAKSNLDTQKKQLDRTRALVKEGALAGSQLDQQQSTYDAADAQYRNALEAVRINQNGSRIEDIQSAQEQVREAQEAVQNAKAAKDLDPLMQDQVQSARAQLASAVAQVRSAQANVAVAQQSLSDAQIRAPFDGRVSGRPIQAGTVASSGTAIVRIVGKQGMYFDASVPQEVLGQVVIGQQVRVSLDGLTGRELKAHVAALNPLGQTIGRLFSVRVQLDGDQTGIQPGMFARGAIAIRTIPNAIVVPTTAVLNDSNNEPYVVTVDNGKAKRLKVKVGLLKDDNRQIIGVPEGTQVMVAGNYGLVDGAKVNVQSAGTATAKAANPDAGSGG